MERLEFYCDNMRIFGNLHLPYAGAPCIITLHGLESSKDSGKWPIIASRLHSEGYACLRFSFRGCGEGREKSEGEFEDVTLTARIEDYKSALEHLKNTGEVDTNRLGVIGSSFGGMVAIAAQDRRVRAIVTLATPYEMPRFKRLQIPGQEGDYHVLPSGRRVKRSFYEDLRGYDLLKAVKDSPPTLIIQGNLDEVVPVEHARKLYEYASEPKGLEIVEGADHTFSRAEHLNRVADSCLEWFKKYV